MKHSKDQGAPQIIELSDYLGDSLPIEEAEWSLHGVGCRHTKVILDGQSHTVTCKDCEKDLDPFWYLQLLAREWRQRSYRDERAREAFAKLREQRRNAEARGRFYEQPKSGVGHDAWDIFTTAWGDGLAYMYRRGSEWYGVNKRGEQYNASYARSLIASSTSNG